MRLIDADKLRGLYDEDYDIIDKARTVNAIPIEWIKTEKEKYPFYYQDGIDLLLFKWEEYSTRKIWEKENEKD